MSEVSLEVTRGKSTIECIVKIDTHADIMEWSINMFTSLNDKWMSSAGKVTNKKDIARVGQPQCNAAKKWDGLSSPLSRVIVT